MVGFVWEVRCAEQSLSRFYDLDWLYQGREQSLWDIGEKSGDREQFLWVAWQLAGDGAAWGKGWLTPSDGRGGSRLVSFAFEVPDG